MKVIKGLASRAWQFPAVQFACFFLLILASRSAIADWNYVPSGSMKPTILEGDLVLVNRLAYDLKVPFTTAHLAEWDEPQRGDVVVAYSPGDGQRIIKRVVAVPGDTVELMGQSLLVNGVRPEFEAFPSERLSPLKPADRSSHAFAYESLLGHRRAVMVGPQITAPPMNEPITIPEGQFFLMGDHRNNSHDSRYYGTVPRDQILGRASYVIGSVDIDDGWLPRWQRFFSSMDS